MLFEIYVEIYVLLHDTVLCSKTIDIIMAKNDLLEERTD